MRAMRIVGVGCQVVGCQGGDQGRLAPETRHLTPRLFCSGRRGDHAVQLHDLVAGGVAADLLFDLQRDRGILLEELTRVLAALTETRLAKAEERAALADD